LLNAAAWTCLLLPLASTVVITRGGTRISRRLACYSSTLTTMGAFAAAVALARHPAPVAGRSADDGRRVVRTHPPLVSVRRLELEPHRPGRGEPAQHEGIGQRPHTEQRNVLQPCGVDRCHADRVEAVEPVRPRLHQPRGREGFEAHLHRTPGQALVRCNRAERTGQRHH